MLSTSGNSCCLQLHLSVISIDNIYINKNGKIFLSVKYIKVYLEPIHLIVHIFFLALTVFNVQKKFNVKYMHVSYNKYNIKSLS